MNILQVCAYAAPYKGNFIESLLKLDEELEKRGHHTIYAFCEYARDKQWCIELQKTRKVYFLPQRHARIKPKTYSLLCKILKDEHIDIVHSHFELYDLPLGIVAPKSCKVFWHLHDPIQKGKSYKTDFFAKLQYDFFSKNVILLSVCDYYKTVAINYGFIEKNAKTIVNGIDLSRITYPYESQAVCYDFLTFGWDFHRKGSDLIFNAMNRLYREGYRFKLLFNCSTGTLDTLITFLGGELPDWLEVGMPVEDVNTLFMKTKTFIQASRRETFSYAVCEAAYAGLDVISSDISGLEWAHSIPSVSFFENENEEELYVLLKERLDNHVQLSQETIRLSRMIIEENFSTEVWAKRIIREYGIE